MPFESRYVDAAEAEIVDNLMSVTDDADKGMKAALDHFYEDDNFPDFVIKTDGEPSAFRYPMLVLTVQQAQSTETEIIDEGDYLDQVLTVGAGMVVHSAESLKDARAKAKKYARAFRAVVRSAAVSDLLPATARVFSHKIDIVTRYLRHGTKGTEFVQPVEIEIKIRFGES